MLTQPIQDASLTFWQQVLIASISGGILGAISGFFSPALNWAIEKRRLLIDSRKSMIKQWRSEILSASGICEPPAAKANALPFRIRLKDTMSYNQLKKHISKDLVSEINAYLPDEYNSMSEEELRECILDQIANLESKWGLV